MARYRGSCHCGAIAFEAEGELKGLEVCNCSYCARAAYVHWYVPPAAFRVIRGEHAYETYQFGTHTSRNHFCRTCGISPFRRARSDPNLVDVNVRCLESVDIETLEVRRFDGRNWEQAMQQRPGRHSGS
jgi:hypothetical protein